MAGGLLFFVVVSFHLGLKYSTSHTDSRVERAEKKRGEKTGSTHRFSHSKERVKQEERFDSFMHRLAAFVFSLTPVTTERGKKKRKRKGGKNRKEMADYQPEKIRCMMSSTLIPKKNFFFSSSE